MRFGRQLEIFAPRWTWAVLVPVALIAALLGIVWFFHPRVGELSLLAIVLTMWIPRSWTTIVVAVLGASLPLFHVVREFLGSSHNHMFDDAVSLVIIAVTALAVLYRKRNLARAQRSFTRLREQQFDLVRLAGEQAIIDGDVARAAEQISELASRLIGVERAGVWLLSEDRSELRCIDLYCARSGKHQRGQVLNAKDFPRYFAALATGRAIDAADALTDSRTSEFSEIYLKPLGLRSMLDAAIRVGGEVIGTVFHE